MRSHLLRTLALVFFWFVGNVHTKECGAGLACATEPPPSAAASGAQHGADPDAPAFGGGFWERSKLTGDWGGLRSRLAQAGVTLDADVTQFYQGVTSGGRKQTFEYGGHGNYVLNVDTGKLTGLAGLFLTVRAEHRFGENINQETGTLLPAAVAANLPVSNSRALYFTDALVTQFLSESFALFAGKMQTLDGDKNDFAHGRGKDQFLNMVFVNDPAQALTIPYSTLGAGFVLVKDQEP